MIKNVVPSGSFSRRISFFSPSIGLYCLFWLFGVWYEPNSWSQLSTRFKRHTFLGTDLPAFLQRLFPTCYTSHFLFIYIFMLQMLNSGKTGSALSPTFLKIHVFQFITSPTKLWFFLHTATYIDVWSSRLLSMEWEGNCFPCNCTWLRDVKVSLRRICHVDHLHYGELDTKMAQYLPGGGNLFAVKAIMLLDYKKWIFSFLNFLKVVFPTFIRSRLRLRKFSE